MEKKFDAIAEVARQTRSGNGFEVKAGSINEVIGAATKEAKDENAHLVPMAAEILENQMKGLEVGGKLMFNWACSVLNIKVERVA
jgi:hypothetical protein